MYLFPRIYGFTESSKRVAFEQNLTVYTTLVDPVLDPFCLCSKTQNTCCIAQTFRYHDNVNGNVDNNFIIDPQRYKNKDQRGLKQQRITRCLLY